MAGVTHLGEPRVALSLGTVGLLEAAGRRVRIRLSRSSEEQLGGTRRWVFWLGIPAALGMMELIKGWADRPRPFEVYPYLAAAHAEMGRSFPSGHATAVFALAAALAMRWPRFWSLWFSMAALVGVSRVALGVHWPSDVIAGAIVGSGTVFCFAWMQGKRIKGG